MVSGNYVNKVGSTPATQGAVQSKKNQKASGTDFVQGVASTKEDWQSGKRGFGGVKRRK